ncbi:MAG: ABC transporter permease [Deltaproteobacteria bacterium]|nr:ABC transporter permease [Deltaproteobacteria bacterium]
MRTLANIYRLGVKELWSLIRDPAMIVLIVYVFTVAIYVAADAQPESVHMATIAIVDEDDSPLSSRIAMAFFPPMFIPPYMIGLDAIDSGMDKDAFTFSLDIPPNFQRDVLAGKNPDIQLNVDATRMSQAFVGGGYIQEIIMDEVNEFIKRYRREESVPVDLTLRNRFNPNLTRSWFGSIVELINNITMLSIILTGAALIREREHGTIEHLLVMPVTPFEIMTAKIWSMALVVLVAASLSLAFIVQGALHVPIEGSVALFLIGTAMHLFATTSMGIFLATLARSMPQFGMLLILILLPMQMLSGGNTPRESMPQMVQTIMLLAPTTHFIEMGQSILYRGAGIAVVYKSYLALAAIGGALFALSLGRFRKTITQMT